MSGRMTVVLAIVGAAACYGSDVPLPPPVDSTGCAAAEDHLHAVEQAEGQPCPLAAPSERGRSFTQSCVLLAQSGQALPTTCISVAASCAAAMECR